MSNSLRRLKPDEADHVLEEEIDAEDAPELVGMIFEKARGIAEKGQRIADELDAGLQTRRIALLPAHGHSRAG
jgi:hypothetical protein